MWAALTSDNATFYEYCTGDKTPVCHPANLADGPAVTLKLAPEDAKSPDKKKFKAPLLYFPHDNPGVYAICEEVT